MSYTSLTNYVQHMTSVKCNNQWEIRSSQKAKKNKPSFQDIHLTKQFHAINQGSVHSRDKGVGLVFILHGGPERLG